jgi:hypothetical protein
MEDVLIDTLIIQVDLVWMKLFVIELLDLFECSFLTLLLENPFDATLDHSQS